MSPFGRRRVRSDESLRRYCRWQVASSAVTEQWQTGTTMGNFHYSMPSPLPTRVLADMILFYATPDLRAELVNDETLLEMISAETAEIISTWTPSTSWERSIVSHGRHIQWLVWKTTNMHDDSMGEIYIDPDEVVAPWRINIETLPDYHQQLPAPTLLNDVD